MLLDYSDRALGSRWEGCGFDPRPMLDGNGVKAKPGSITAPNSGSLWKNKLRAHQNCFFYLKK